MRAVRQLRKELGTDHGTIKRVAEQLGYRHRVAAGLGQAGRDRRRREAGGDVGGGGPDQGARAGELRELRRANAILRSASAFFAAELDRPQK